MNKVKIDEIDIKILEILQENARETNAEIARRVNLVPSATLERIRRLEKLKIIKGYHTCIDPMILNCKFLAFVYIKTEPNQSYSHFFDSFNKYPEIQEIHHVAGEDCYLLKVRAKDTPNFYRFLRDVILKIEGVTDTRSEIVMDTEKETLSIPLSNYKDE